MESFKFNHIKLQGAGIEVLLSLVVNEINANRSKFLIFKDLKHKISIAAVNSDWEELKKLNKQLTERFGVSSLSAHNDVLIHRNIDDEFEKWYYETVGKNSGSLYNFLVYHFRQLTDLSISSLSYRRRTLDYINKIEVDVDIREYLRIKLTRITNSNKSIEGYIRVVLGLGIAELFNSLDYIVWYVQSNMSELNVYIEDLLNESDTHDSGIYTNVLENIVEEFDFSNLTFAFNYFSDEKISIIPPEINQDMIKELLNIKEKDVLYSESVKKLWKIADVLSNTNSVYFLDSVITNENVRRSFDIARLVVSSRISFTTSGNEISLDNQRDLNYLRNYSSQTVNISKVSLNNKSLAGLDVLQSLESDFWSAILKSVELYFKDNVYLDIVPLHDILSEKRWINVKLYKSNIRLVIALHMYCELYPGDEKIVSLMSSAWEEFVFSNGINLPSQVNEDFLLSLADIDKELWIYFLKNICIPEVMDSGVEFESSIAVEEERMRVCAVLVKIDAKNSKVYQEEIISISTKLKLQEGVSIFDNSRIYVDLDGLIGWCRANLKEEIDKVLLNINQDTNKLQSDQDFDNAISEALNFSTRRLEKYLEVPENDTENLLIYIIDEIKEQFLNNNHFGLDRFLSMRVRHGTLSGFLRSAVEKKKLISFKNSTGESYSINSYWVSRCLSRDPSAQQTVGEAFGDFSYKFDEIIRQLTQETLKINNKNDDKGVIEIKVLPVSLKSIKRGISAETNLKSFVEGVYYVLWESIEPSLKSVRDLLKGEINNNLTDAINLLKDATVKKGIEFGDINIGSAIQEAIDDVQRATARSASWFIPSHSRAVAKSYSLDEIVDIALHSAGRVHSSILARVNKEIDSHNKMTVSVMYRIVDIIFILLDNIYKHTNNSHSDQDIDISVIEKENEGSINISCSNRLSEQELIKIENTIKIIDELSKADYKVIEIKNKTEGGTGFYKLHKMISVGHKGKIYATVDGNIFTINVKLPVDYVSSEIIKRIAEAIE